MGIEELTSRTDSPDARRQHEEFIDASNAFIQAMIRRERLRIGQHVHCEQESFPVRITGTSRVICGNEIAD